MQRARPTFPIPGQEDTRRRSERRSGPGAGDLTREWHGATYEIQASQQRQEGDPQQIALREPSGYEHPQHLGSDVLDPGGPRVWPTSGRVSYGPQQSRAVEFDQAVQAAAELGALHRILGFRDRRFEGRRYRPTNDEDELLGRQEPYDMREVPFERYLTY
jgi:hypothetical protein